MEELIPTATLEKTLADQAEAAEVRIRTATEIEAQEFAEAFDRETEVLVAAIRADFAGWTARVQADLEKALPLGRRRLEAAYLEQSLGRAFEDLAGEIDEGLWRRVFGSRLTAVLPALVRDGAPVDLTVSGWTEPDTEKWLTTLVPGARVVATPGSPGDRSLRAAGVGGRAVYRVSVRQLWDELRETQREELVDALFPGRTHAGSR